jgi:NAD(P)-dependent dehydrogenase (short-subunit alcohol dehydrogenase family)
MKKLILITGCSSGIGRAAALLFAANGWQVIATMRDASKAGALATHDHVRVLELDVTVRATIASAVARVLADYGRLDVLVNNAGFGAFGPFETASTELIERQLATNLIGSMDLTRAALPIMRAQRSGTIINIASIGGLVTMPLNAIYHATKYAMVGWTEALSYELAPLGIAAKFVAPGGVATNFAGDSLARTFEDERHPYADTVSKVMQAFTARSASYSTPDQIALTIYRAATDASGQVGYVVGADAEALLAARAQLGEAGYLAMMMRRFGLDAPAAPGAAPTARDDASA